MCLPLLRSTPSCSPSSIGRPAKRKTCSTTGQVRGRVGVRLRVRVRLRLRAVAYLLDHGPCVGVEVLRPQHQQLALLVRVRARARVRVGVRVRARARARVGVRVRLRVRVRVRVRGWTSSWLSAKWRRNLRRCSAYLG